MSKFYIEVDCAGAEASGYEDRLPWVCYGTIVAEGDSLEECLETATVDLIDQDGGERGFEDAQSDWMQAEVEREFMRKYNPDGSLRQWTRVVVQLDETKPHWARKAGLDTKCAELGMHRIRVTGDFDAKLTYIYGDVEDFGQFSAAVGRAPWADLAGVYLVEERGS